MIRELALCKGRHEMPKGIEGAIFQKEVDPLDIQGLENEARKKFLSLSTIKEEDVLHLYVTGLTVALIAALNVATEYFGHVILYHYDRVSCEYYPQEVKF